MRILVYDDYTAGIDPAGAVAETQADVHRALVAALAVDLARLGQHDVRVTMPVGADLATDLAWAEAAVVLAPEANDRLTDLAEQVEAAGVRLLGPTAAAIRLISDRMGLALALGDAGLPVPRTWAIDRRRIDLVTRITDRLGFPLVIKPVTGAGGRGARVVRAADEVDAALQAASEVAGDDTVLVQQYVPGLGVGVGVVVANDRARPVGLFGALVSEPPHLVIERCATPLDHPGQEQAIEVACKAALAIAGLTGYVEVDLILAEQGAVLIEVAARPTLGTLALRRSRQFNLAQLILEACLEGRLPDTRFWPPALPALVDIDNPAAALAPATPFG